MASLISPSSCGFAKVLALEADSWAKENITKNEAESKTKFTSRFLRARYDKYMEYFKESREFEIPFTSFQKKLPVLQRIYKNWSPHKREQLHNFKETFSIERWTKLTSAKKWERSLNNCKACYHYHIEELSYFSIRARTFLNAAKINPFHASKELKFKKHKGKPLNDITLRLVNQINTYYQENCEVSFTEALVKANIGVQKKLSPAEMKQQRRERSRMITNKMQEQWNKNTVERYKLSNKIDSSFTKCYVI